MRNRHRTTWMRAGAFLLVCLLGSIAVSTAVPPSYDGKWELGFYFPFGKFDTDVPVKDMMGEDDAIRSAFGQGIDLAFNFNSHNAVETNNSWINSDSEDRRGANHFSVRTRFNILNYRYTMNHCQRWSSFITAGVGWFRSKALEAQHESFGGSVLAAGLGVRFYTSHRSSLFVMAQRARVNLNPRDANNIIIAAGITSHLGKGPNTFQPPPAVSDEDD